jgi:hypothetical protein
MANRVLSYRQLILPAVILGNPNEGLETTGFAGHIELVLGGRCEATSNFRLSVLPVGSLTPNRFRCVGMQG